MVHDDVLVYRGHMESGNFRVWNCDFEICRNLELPESRVRISWTVWIHDILDLRFLVELSKVWFGRFREFIASCTVSRYLPGW